MRCYKSGFFDAFELLYVTTITETYNICASSPWCRKQYRALLPLLRKILAPSMSLCIMPEAAVLGRL